MDNVSSIGVLGLIKTGLSVLLSGTIAVTLALVTGGPAVGLADAVAAATPTQTHCADLLVVGVRGSGESEGYGNKVAYAVNEIHKQLDAQRDVRYVALDYPAAPMSVLGTDLFAAFALRSTWQYFESVNQGTLELNDVLGDSSVNCPDEKWLLVGYSQGALVINEAVRLFTDPARYAGIVKIADPARAKNSAITNLGSAATGNGVTPVFAYPSTPFPSSLAGVTVELCNQYDIVCDTENAAAARTVSLAVPDGVSIHTSYTSSEIQSTITQAVARTLASAVPATRIQQVTVCGGTRDFTGTLDLKARSAGAQLPTWAIEPGYSPQPGVVATPTNFWLGESGYFTLEPGGAYHGTLPQGAYSVPLSVSAEGMTPAHATLEIYIVASCEAVAKCGPQFAPAIPQGRDDRSENITGRLFCPDGRPAGGIYVTLLTTTPVGLYPVAGYAQTAADGSYWIHNDYKAFAALMINYVPGFTGLNTDQNFPGSFANGAINLQNAGLIALGAGPGSVTNLPDYKLTDYGFIKGNIDLTGPTTSGSGLAFAKYAGAPGFGSDLYYGEWCVNTTDARNCLYTQDAEGGFTFRVLPGKYDIGLTSHNESGFYGRWYGDPATAAPFSLEAPSAEASMVQVQQGETLALRAVVLSSVYHLSGWLSEKIKGDTHVQEPQFNVRISSYRLTGDQWVYDHGTGGTIGGDGIVDSSGGGSYGLSLYPGQYKLVFNDPASDGYDPYYETLYYPNGHSLDEAQIIVAAANQNVQLTAGSVIRRADDVPSSIVTSASLSVSPSGSAPAGTTVTVTGTVSPSSTIGTITIFDGTTRLGGGAVAGGVFTTGVSGLAVGDHSLTASFTPADSQAYQSSSSVAVGFSVIQQTAPPSAPTGVTATAGDAQGTVSWTAPAGPAVTSYTVTASPGGAHASTAGTSATVSSLVNGNAYVFTVTASNQGGTSPASAPSGTVTPSSPVQRYITHVYSDLFDRTPDPTGLATWTNALRAGTPYGEVANAITYSEEYRSKLIRASYQHYLGRDAEPAGLAFWLHTMQGGMHIEQMQAGFISSPEFYGRGGNNDRGWITLLYQTVLNRNPAASEVDFWQQRSQLGSTRYDIALGFLYSSEHLTTVVDGYYVDLLRRHIDPSGQATWVSAIQRGARDEEIIASIVSSTEYRART